MIHQPKQTQLPLTLLALSSLLAAACSTSTIAAEIDANGAAFGGVVRAGERAVLSAELDAMVTTMPHREGEYFKKGDLLVGLDCTLAGAAHEQAKARFGVAKKDHESNKQLAGLNSVSQLEIAVTKGKLSETAAELVVATHRIERCEVRAPFDGVVVRQDVRRFERVESGNQLLEIASSTEHSVEFLVPSEKAIELSIGHPFTFSVGETGQVLNGQIVSMIPDVDPVSRTIKVIGELPSLEKTLTDESDSTEDQQTVLAAALPGDATTENPTGNPIPLWPGMSGWVELSE